MPALVLELRENWTALLLSTIAVFLLVRLAKVFRVAFLSPLCAVPGPWYSRFTRLPGVIAALSHQQVQYFHALHVKYGPFVRVAPNEVMIADVAAYKKIHRVGGHFVKSDFYHYMGPNDLGNPPYGLFQMTDVTDHAKRRRLLGRGFTSTSLRTDWEDVIRTKVVAAIQGMHMDAKAGNGEVDVRKWWVLMASDVASHLMFGESFDQLKVGKPDLWFEDIKIAINASFLSLSFPLLYDLAKRVPFLNQRHFFHAHQTILDKGNTAVANASQLSGTKSLFAKVLGQSSKAEGTLTDKEIALEASSFIVAGSDTTSSSLTYAIWAVLSNESLREDLQKELANTAEPLTDAYLEKLPILNAAILETLRLYNPVPAPLPRITPQPGVELGGFTIPAGTTVATQSWSLHRDPVAFPDPERFDYTRWLTPEEGILLESSHPAFHPFGGGSRICIGKNLALMQLRYGTAIFFREFGRAQLAPSTTPRSMEMENLLIIEPKSKVCRVILNRP